MSFDSYPARTLTFGANDPVPSAALNAIQDGIIAVSENLDELGAQLHSGTATGESTDSPAADPHGGVAVWIERWTNGLNVVVLDTSADWRDRWVTVVGVRSASAAVKPGGADDHTATWTLEDGATANWVGIFYTEAGTAGNDLLHYRTLTTDNGVEVGRLFARNTDGALCLRKNTHTGADFWVAARVEGSPVQNHQ